MSKLVNRVVLASLLSLCVLGIPLTSASADENVAPQTAYEIFTCQELQDISNDLAGTYALGSDVDCAGFDFVSIGNVSPFTGTFDGGGFTIQNVSVQIFQNTSGATITNIVVATTTTSTTTLPVTTLPKSPQDSTVKSTISTPSSSSRSSSNLASASASATTTTTTTTLPPVTGDLTIDVSKKTSTGSQVRDLLTGSTLNINIVNGSQSYVTTAGLKTLGTDNAEIAFANEFISNDSTVKLLGTTQIDVDNNRTKDITVELTSISTDRATIRITPIYAVSASKPIVKDSNSNFWNYGKYGIGFVVFLVLIGSAKSYVTYRKNKE